MQSRLKIPFTQFLSISLSSLLILSVSQQSAHAESFKILGSRALGMGGAFVAVAEDAMAQYWNPAGIATQKNFDMEIPVGVRAEATNGMLKDANALSNLADKYRRVQTAQQNGAPLDIDTMASILKTLQTLSGLNAPGKGALVEVQGGLNARIARVAVSVNNFTSVGVSPFVDTVNVGLGASAGNAGVSFAGVSVANPGNAAQTAARDTILAPLNDIGYATLNSLTGGALASAGIANTTQLANALVNQGVTAGLTDQQIQEAAAQIAASEPAVKSLLQNAATGTTYKDNTSNATLRGISLAEVAVGYAHRFFLDDLYVGGNLKALVGRVGYYRFEFLKNDISGSAALDDYDRNSKQSVQPGIDIGMMLDKRERWRTKMGVVARNINSPKFDQPATAPLEPKYRVEPQLRAGVAVYPFKSTAWVVSSDLDLTSNITPVPGYSSRFWALGTEVNVINRNMFNLALRAGLTNNVAEADSKASYTGGIGLKILHFFVDIAGAVSSQTEEVKTDSSGKTQKVPQNFQVGAALGLNF